MAAIVANKVKRQRVIRDAKTAAESSAGLENQQLHQRNAAVRSKQLSQEEFLQQQQKILYYQQVIGDTTDQGTLRPGRGRLLSMALRGIFINDVIKIFLLPLSDQHFYGQL
jgi:hypothetical protein